MMLIRDSEMDEMQRVWSLSGLALLRAMGRKPVSESATATAMWDVSLEEQNEDVIRMVRYVAQQRMDAAEYARRAARVETALGGARNA